MYLYGVHVQWVECRSMHMHAHVGVVCACIPVCIACTCGLCMLHTCVCMHTGVHLGVHGSGCDSGVCLGGYEYVDTLVCEGMDLGVMGTHGCKCKC